MSDYERGFSEGFERGYEAGRKAAGRDVPAPVFVPSNWPADCGCQPGTICNSATCQRRLTTTFFYSDGRLVGMGEGGVG